MLKKKSFKKSSKNIEYVKSERDVMARVSNPFLVGLKYAFQNDRKLFFVMEFVPGTQNIELQCTKQEKTSFYKWKGEF